MELFQIITTATIASALVFIILRFSRNSKYKFPRGPLGNWVPFVGYLPFMGDVPHEKLCQLARKYGDVFTLKFGAYPMVVLNTPTLIKDTFKEQSFSGRPNYLLAMAVTKDGLTFATGNEANEQRRFVLKTLRDFGFGKRSMEKLVQDEVTELIQFFKDSGSETVHNLEYLFGLSVINALWSILASRKFSITDQYAKRAYQVCIEGFIDPPVSGSLWFLPSVAKAFPNASGYNSIVRAVEELRELVSEVVESHKNEFKQNHAVKDFVDAYLAKIKEVEDEGDTQSSFYGERGQTNLLHVLIDLFTAGSDTLNSSLNFAIKYLCENKDILKELQTEIDKVANEAKQITLDDRKNLPLLDAVLTETLRLSSIVTNGILHSTTNEPTELVVNGNTYVLPKDTIVMPNLYWVHHNSEYWEDPYRFDPHRYLREGGCKLKHDVLAFSTGKRVCIAEQMAQAEFFLFLGGLVANFDFEGVEGVGDQFGGVKCGLVLNVKGLRVAVKER